MENWEESLGDTRSIPAPPAPPPGQVPTAGVARRRALNLGALSMNSEGAWVSKAFCWA